MAAPDAPRPSLLRGNAALIACCVLGLYDAAYIAKWAAGAPFPPFGDFFGFWTFGRFAQAHGGLIYDAGALIPFQQEVLPGLRGGYPFPYPPPFLLLLAPLALLPLGAAYIVWIGGTLAAYLAGVLGWRGGLLPSVALVVVPTTLLDVISGQNGLLTAALLAGGMRCLIATPGTRPGRPAAPVLAGVLLGMATYKPQFALLLPAVLLATRAWLTIGVACLTALLLAFISSLAFGWSVWPDWVRGMAGYQALLAMNTPNLLHLMPGVLAGARLLGLPGWLGVALQAIMSVWVVVTVWRLCARRLGLPEIAAALLGTMLLTPYALIYDAPIMTAGVALYWRALGDAGPDLADLAVSVLLVATLVTMVGSSLPMVAPLLLAAQLYLAARFARRVT